MSDLIITQAQIMVTTVGTIIPAKVGDGGSLIMVGTEVGVILITVGGGAGGKAKKLPV
jgi:hypothetical protein